LFFGPADDASLALPEAFVLRKRGRIVSSSQQGWLAITLVSLTWLAGATIACEPRVPGPVCLRFREPTSCLFVLWAGPGCLDKVVLAASISLTARGCDLCDDAGHMAGISLRLMEPGEFAFVDEFGQVYEANLGQGANDWPSVGAIQVFRPNPGVRVPVGTVLSRNDLRALGELGCGRYAGWIPKLVPVSFRLLQESSECFRLLPGRPDDTLGQQCSPAGALVCRSPQLESRRLACRRHLFKARAEKRGRFD